MARGRLGSVRQTGGVTSTLRTRTTRPTATFAAIVMGGWLALLWVLELIDQLTAHALDRYGIVPREVDSLPSVYAAPFLHAGWNHLIANSVPFVVLGFLVLLGGLARWLWSTLTSVTASGLFAWLLSPPNTVTIGASGLIFGWLTYLLARGWLTRDTRQMLIAAAVLVVYGGVLWGVLPGAAGVSWQGHLGGAFGGILAAYLLHRRSRPRPAA